MKKSQIFWKVPLTLRIKNYPNSKNIKFLTKIFLCQKHKFGDFSKKSTWILVSSKNATSCIFCRNRGRCYNKLSIYFIFLYFYPPAQWKMEKVVPQPAPSVTNSATFWRANEEHLLKHLRFFKLRIRRKVETKKVFLQLLFWKWIPNWKSQTWKQERTR